MRNHSIRNTAYRMNLGMLFNWLNRKPAIFKKPLKIRSNFTFFKELDLPENPRSIASAKARGRFQEGIEPCGRCFFYNLQRL